MRTIHLEYTASESRKLPTIWLHESNDSCLWVPHQRLHLDHDRSIEAFEVTNDMFVGET